MSIAAQRGRIASLALLFSLALQGCWDDPDSCVLSATCPAEPRDAALDHALDVGSDRWTVDMAMSDAPGDNVGDKRDVSFPEPQRDASSDARVDISVADSRNDNRGPDAPSSSNDVSVADSATDVHCTAGASCDVPDKPCRVGSKICSAGSSVCAETADKPNGTVCGPGLVCQIGACKACAMGESCVPANPCHTGSLVCTSGAPVCTDTGTAVAPGTACGPDKVCSSSGECTACANGATCTLMGKPCRLGKTACSTGAPVCVESMNAPDGASCGMNRVCSSGVCGECTTGAPCRPANPCHAGSLNCSTGTPVCNDTTVPLTDGASCGNNMVCKAGNCEACTAGVTCQPTDPCKTGTTSCATGSSVCVANANKPAGTSCGPGQSCSAGRTTSATVCDSNGQCAMPTVTTCTSGFCNASGSDCLTCGAGQATCAGACCAAGQGCCNNACAALDTATNCGVCGNACVTGKVCSGQQCLWGDGKVCANGADCASGVCGGRCCPAGTSCSCTQPSGGNLVANPGFDVNLAGWNIDSGPGTFAWQPRGVPDEWGYSGDAEACPFSGSVSLTCNKQDPNEACQSMWQCISLRDGATYNFGHKMGNEGGGETHCAIEIWTQTACTGASTLIRDDMWVNLNWPGGWQTTTFDSGAHASARIHCYRTGGGSGRVDMVFLTPHPGGY
jgi:hypothetical protein